MGGGRGEGVTEPGWGLRGGGFIVGSSVGVGVDGQGRGWGSGGRKGSRGVEEGVAVRVYG